MDLRLELVVGFEDLFEQSLERRLDGFGVRALRDLKDGRRVEKVTEKHVARSRRVVAAHKPVKARILDRPEGPRVIVYRQRRHDRLRIGLKQVDTLLRIEAQFW